MPSAVLYYTGWVRIYADTAIPIDARRVGSRDGMNSIGAADSSRDSDDYSHVALSI